LKTVDGMTPSCRSTPLTKTNSNSSSRGSKATNEEVKVRNRTDLLSLSLSSLKIVIATIVYYRSVGRHVQLSRPAAGGLSKSYHKKRINMFPLIFIQSSTRTVTAAAIDDFNTLELMI
jgi:hypothetical protein